MKKGKEKDIGIIAIILCQTQKPLNEHSGALECGNYVLKSGCNIQGRCEYNNRQADGTEPYRKM